MRLPVRRCALPLTVVQPLAVTSRYTGEVATAAMGWCSVALEVANEHPSAVLTISDVEVHVGETTRAGARTSQRFTAPGSRGGSGKAGRVRRRGVSGGGASAPLEVGPIITCAVHFSSAL